MAVYKWNIIDQESTKEILEDYLNGSDSYDWKVIEISCLPDVAEDELRHYYLDRYTKRSDWAKYDDVTKNALRAFGLTESQAEKLYLDPDFSSGPSLVTLDRARSFGIEELAVKLSEYMSNSGVDETDDILDLLKKTEVRLRNLIDQRGKPQINFLPISRNEVWSDVWSRLFLGKVGASSELRQYSGFWFIKSPDGRLKAWHSDLDWANPNKYFRIRTLDLEDYYQELRNILESNIPNTPWLTADDIERSNIWIIPAGGF